MFKVNGIWHLDQDGDIKVRDGFITVDVADMPVDSTDAERAIQIANGLQPKDIAVFASVIGSDQIYENPAGFVVTTVDGDGGGVIVHRDKIEKSPRDWASEYTLQLWEALEEANSSVFEQFGLQSLQAYIHSPTRKKMSKIIVSLQIFNTA